MGTHYPGSDEEVRALDAFIKLMRASNSVLARVGAAIGQEGFSVSQFGVLEALYHLGPMCQSKLAQKLLKSGGNLTVVIDNLERRGLVQRRRDPQDRRFVVVDLTEPGRRAIRGSFPRVLERIVAEMGVLSGAEQEKLGRLCRKLGLTCVERTS